MPQTSTDYMSTSSEYCSESACDTTTQLARNDCISTAQAAKDKLLETNLLLMSINDRNLEIHRQKLSRML